MRLVTTALIALTAMQARAVDRGFTQPSGDWATTNWTGGVKPGAADRSFIGGTSPIGSANQAEVTVTTDEAGVALGDMYIGYLSNSNSTGIVRVQTGGALRGVNLYLTSAGTNTVDADYPGVAAILYQSGGSIEFNVVALGSAAGRGAFELSDGAVVNRRIYAGSVGAGTVVQTGGQITGYNGNTAWGNIDIGIGVQPGTFIQSGGVNDLNQLQIGAGGAGGGTFVISGGTNTLHGRYLAASGGPASILQTGGRIVGLNNAQFAYNRPLTYTQSGGSVEIAGTFQVGENSTAGRMLCNVAGGSLSVAGAGSLRHGTVINQSGGTVTFTTSLNLGVAGLPSTYNLAGGTLNVGTLSRTIAGSTLNLTREGVLSATTVSFDLVNDGGTVAPGLGGTTAKMGVNGAFRNAPGGVVRIELGGTGQGSTYDWLSVSGSAALDGSLTVALVNGFVPAPGDSFTVLTAGTLAGVFANAPASGARYPLGSGSFVVTYSATSVIISGYEALGTVVDNGDGATDDLPTSAALRGRLLAEVASPTACRFLWWEGGNATTNSVDMGDQSVGESFTNALNGLTPNTMYVYRTHATNAAGEVLSAELERFDTLGPPQIQNRDPLSVNTNSVAAAGVLSGQNRGMVTVFWGLTDGGTNAVAWDTSTALTEEQWPNTAFFAELTGLTRFTNYFYRWYATNAYGEGWADASSGFFTQSATTDWRWSTPGGGDYRQGTNYNGGASVMLPPTSADVIWLGYSTYPAAQHNSTVTIDEPALSKQLVVGYHGTGNTLVVRSGSLTTAGQMDIGGGNTFRHDAGTSTLTVAAVYVGNRGVAAQARFLLEGGEVRTLGQSLNVGYSNPGYLRTAAGTVLDTSTAGTRSGSGGSLQIGQSNGAGTWDFEAGSEVYVGGTMAVANGGVGQVTQAEGTRLTVMGNLYPGQSQSGTWTQNGGTNLVTGSFLPGVSGGSGIYNLNSGVLSVTAASSMRNGSIVNQSGGTATFTASLNIGLAGAACAYNLSGGTLNVGTLSRTVAGSTLNLTGGGMLSAGTVSFDLHNTAGVVAPGLAGAAGKTQVNGTYTAGAGSVLEMQIAGTGQGTTHDWLSVSGVVTLGGELQLVLVNGFEPVATQAFTLVSGSGVNGVFTNAPVSGARAFFSDGTSAMVAYTPTAVVASHVLPPGTHVANTGGATDILGTSATLHGTLLADAAPPTSVTIRYWDVGGSTTNVVDLGVQTQGVVFAAAVSGLTPLTDYAYQCTATNASGLFWAPDSERFTTWLEEIPGGVEYRFQEGVNGYAGTQDSATPAGAGLWVFTPGMDPSMSVGQGYFAANVTYAHDQIPPHEVDDWRPSRSIIRFDVSSLAAELKPETRIARVALFLTRVGNSGDYADTPLELYALPAADGGWREGFVYWDDMGAACWLWKALEVHSWSATPPTLLDTVNMRSTDPDGTVYTFSTTNTAFLAEAITNAAANAGFRLVAPVIEYGQPGRLHVILGTSENPTIEWRPLLSVVLDSSQEPGLLLMVR